MHGYVKRIKEIPIYMLSHKLNYIFLRKKLIELLVYSLKVLFLLKVEYYAKIIYINKDDKKRNVFHAKLSLTGEQIKALLNVSLNLVH